VHACRQEAVVIIESDVNKEVMVTWCYPSVTPLELEAVLVAQAEPLIGHAAIVASKAAGRKPSTQYFTRYGRTWAYGFVPMDVVLCL
jgi:hypothetical protein